MFFEGWYPLYRILVVGALAYFFLIAALRAGGKRTLAQMNTFDFVVNVALGSMFATLILSRDIVLAEGATAISLLIGLQFAVTYVTSRFPQFRQAVDAEPSLLFYHGRPLERTMKAQRIGMADLLSAARGQGLSDLSRVDSIVLETNGSLSILPDAKASDSAMRDVGHETGGRA